MLTGLKRAINYWAEFLFGLFIISYVIAFVNDLAVVIYGSNPIEFAQKLTSTNANAIFTILSGWILFKHGNRKFEEQKQSRAEKQEQQKQLTGFRQKYIELKNEIDKNKKDIFLATNQEERKNQLIIFSNHFVSYTNLIYEEMLEIENQLIKAQLKSKWFKSFEQEISDWKLLFSKIYSHSSNDMLTPAQRDFNNLFNIFSITIEGTQTTYISIDKYYEDLYKLKKEKSDKLLNAHNILQSTFRDNFKSLLTNQFKEKNSNLDRFIPTLEETLEHLKSTDNSVIFANNLSRVIEEIRKTKKAS